MKDKQRLRLLPLVVMAALALVAVACTNGDNASSGNDGGGDSGSTAALTPLDFELTWLPDGDMIYYYVGVAQGFYADQGLDVTIKESSDPTLSVKLVGTDKVHMGMAYSGDMIVAAAKGDPVVSVFALTTRSPFGIISPKSAGIEQPSDLIGKKVGVTALPVDQAEFSAMLEEAGVNESQVSVVDPGFSGASQVLVGNLDATSGLDYYEGSILQSAGIDFNFLPYAQYGAPDAPFFDIVANPEWMKTNADTVQEFVTGTKNAIEWARANPQEAVDILVQQFPDLKRKLTATVWNRFSQLMGEGDQLGMHDPAQWDALAAFMKTAGLVDTNVDASKLYTNQFLSG